MAKKDFFSSIQYTPVPATCPHFGSCGGCRFQDISYNEQVSAKQRYLKHLFKKELDVLPAKSIFRYRNRMDFVYAKGCFGLRKRGDFSSVVDLTCCHLVSEPFEKIFLEIKELLAKYSIPDYDFEEHKGFLRYVTIRQATSGFMAIFTTTTPDLALEKTFTELLEKIGIQSVYWLVYDGLTDISIPEVPSYKIIGEEFIEEIVLGKKFLISPWTFFQTSTQMSEMIFSDMKPFVSGNVVDLCCGVGTIGMAIGCEKLTGIEVVPQAITLAKRNAKLNNSKANFFCCDMKKLLDYVPMDVNTLIVDPPRAGMGNKVIKRILSVKPDTIVYMSCNPKTQRIDLELLTDYDVIFHKGYDFFPHTPHMETLCVLKLRQ